MAWPAPSFFVYKNPNIDTPQALPKPLPKPLPKKRPPALVSQQVRVGRTLFSCYFFLPPIDSEGLKLTHCDDNVFYKMIFGFMQ